MTEKDLQALLIKNCKNMGLFACKVDAAGVRGFPDVFIRTKIGVVLVEMKSPNGTGKLSPHQLAMHERLGLLGQHVYTLESVAEVNRLLDSIHTGSI